MLSRVPHGKYTVENYFTFLALFTARKDMIFILISFKKNPTEYYWLLVMNDSQLK